MNVRPLADRILVRRIEEQETKRGGIIIPDTAKEKPQEGEVVAVGTGPHDRGRQAHRARRQEGRPRSCSASTAGTEVKIDGDEYVILREDDVLGVIGSSVE